MMHIPFDVLVLYKDLYALRQDPRAVIEAALPDLTIISVEQAAELQAWFDAA